jgi:hypothetical protein
MKLARCVLPRRNVHPASARFAAGIDGFLQGRTGIIAFAPRGAVIPDIEDRLAYRRLTQGSHQHCACE